MQVILTYHGEERIRKRKGTSKKNAKRAAEEALTHGLKYSDITNLNLRKFMDGKYLSKCTANNMTIYQRYIYLFKDNVLITLFALPNNLANISENIMRRKEKKECTA